MSTCDFQNRVTGAANSIQDRWVLHGVLKQKLPERRAETVRISSPIMLFRGCDTLIQFDGADEIFDQPTTIDNRTIANARSSSRCVQDMDACY